MRYWVMVGRRDFQESFREIPGCYQCAPCLAVIDAAQFPLRLQKTAGLVCPFFNDSGIRLRHRGGHRHTANIVHDPRSVSKILVESTPTRRVFGDDRASNAMTPTGLQEWRERFLEICLQPHGDHQAPPTPK